MRDHELSSEGYIDVTDWKPTACVLCSLNCGLTVDVGGPDGRHITRVRGDDRHPSSRGYLCNKASRVDYYQNPRDRLTTPLRRRRDGRFEAIDWPTAIGEISSKLQAVRDRVGGDKIFYYGGGGQANHLPGAYARTTLGPLGVRYRSNALAQEKTGEFWVADSMFGGWAHGDFEHCEVGVFIGKNPWHSHGVPRARVTLREIARDPARTLIVIDPKRTETADLADLHLRVRPGRDVWLLTAMAAVLVQEGFVNEDWLAEHAEGFEGVMARLSRVAVPRYAVLSGVPEAVVREAARRIGGASRVAVLEDLGVQMNRHSTLVSYVQRLLWILTGNFGRPGTNYLPAGLGSIGRGSPGGTSPVTGAPIIAGLIPCNVIAEEISTDHPDRFRAMIVEAANPVHSLADSEAFRAAMRSLECSVVIDIAMTETARAADYVLPCATQYEKAECAFFNFEFPSNWFHLRRPILEPPAGVLTEAEIHARLAEALGAIPDEVVGELNEALTQGRARFRERLQEVLNEEPRLSAVLPGLLYRTLGRSLPPHLAEAAGLWPVVQSFARRNPGAVRAAGIDAAEEDDLGDALFEAILRAPSGLVFSAEDWDGVWERVRGGRIHLHNEEMLEELDRIDGESPRETSVEYPFLLAAGERRAFTANTVIRDPRWRRKDAGGALAVHPDDARRLNLGEGSRARVTTARAAVEVTVSLSDRMQPGYVSLPNGLGLDYPDEDGRLERVGVAPNELTSLDHRDRFVGTPWHKSIPARIEAI